MFPQQRFLVCGDLKHIANPQGCTRRMLSGGLIHVWVISIYLWAFGLPHLQVACCHASVYLKVHFLSDLCSFYNLSFFSFLRRKYHFPCCWNIVKFQRIILRGRGDKITPRSLDWGGRENSTNNWPGRRKRRNWLRATGKIDFVLYRSAIAFDLNIVLASGLSQ